MDAETYRKPEDKRLLINLGTDLQVEIEGIADRFKSRLVGADPKNFLLIKLPISYEITDQLASGRIIVRYIYKGSIFGFRTSLIQSLPHPFRVAFIRYPKEFENFELRSRERYECFLPITIRIREEEKEGALLDISEEGIRVAFRDREYKPSFLRKGDLVTILIHFPKSPAKEEFITQVCRISNEGGRTIIGLVFHNLDNDRKQLVSNFVSEVKEYL